MSDKKKTMSEKEAVAEKKTVSEKEAVAEKKKTMSEKEAMSEMKTMSEKVALPEKEAMSEKEAVSEKDAVSREEEAEAPRQLTLAELVETDFLRCPQCRQHFTSPTLLPCLHAFCAACLAALPSRPVTNGPLPSCPLTDGALPSRPVTNGPLPSCPLTDGALPSRPVTNGPSAKLVQLQCPLCRASVTVPEDPNPAQAAFLQALCELRATKHGAAERSCSYCQFDGKSEAAGWRCLDCSDDLCEPCARAHRKTRLTRDHLVAPYAQIRNGLYDHDIRARQLPRCPRPHPHPGGQPLARFCCDCLQLACRACEAESHRGHRLEPAEDAVDRLRPEAQSFVRGLRKRIPALAEYRAFLQRQLERLEARRAAVEGGVQRQAEAVHALVDLHRDSLLQDVAAAFGKEAADIESRCTDLGVAQRSLESNAQLLANLLAVGSAPEVLQLHPAVMARLKQLIHMQPSTLAQRLAPRFHAGPATAQNMRIMFGTVELRRVPVEHGEGGEEEEEEEAVPSKARLSVSTLLPEPLDPPRLLCTLPLKLEDEAKEVWPSGLHVRKGSLAVVDRDKPQSEDLRLHLHPSQAQVPVLRQGRAPARQPLRRRPAGERRGGGHRPRGREGQGLRRHRALDRGPGGRVPAPAGHRRQRRGPAGGGGRAAAAAVRAPPGHRQAPAHHPRHGQRRPQAAGGPLLRGRHRAGRPGSHRPRRAQHQGVQLGGAAPGRLRDVRHERQRGAQALRSVC